MSHAMINLTVDSRDPDFVGALVRCIEATAAGKAEITMNVTIIGVLGGDARAKLGDVLRIADERHAGAS